VAQGNAGNGRTILVTGARGFIGRTVQKLLQQSGCNVLPIDQAAPTPGSGHFSAGREILLDITQAEQLRPLFAMRKIVGIVHLAAILPTAARKDPLRASQVNVTGSLNLLELAREFGVRRFVFASSLSIYGTCPAEQVVSETDRAAPEDLYGAAKLYVEQLGRVYADCYGIEFVTLRIGRVVGPGAKSTSSAWRSQIFELLHSNNPAKITVPYVGSERILLVHVNDVAKSLVSLVQASHPRQRVYNAPCESVIVEELKQRVENLNPNLTVELGDRHATGNPRLLDCTRFQNEFGLQTVPIFDQLKNAAEK
jgi:nucleoside-diphosphate-sugar epimerase